MLKKLNFSSPGQKLCKIHKINLVFWKLLCCILFIIMNIHRHTWALPQLFLVRKITDFSHFFPLHDDTCAHNSWGLMPSVLAPGCVSGMSYVKYLKFLVKYSCFYKVRHTGFANPWFPMNLNEDWLLIVKFEHCFWEQRSPKVSHLRTKCWWKFFCTCFFWLSFFLWWHKSWSLIRLRMKAKLLATCACSLEPGLKQRPSFGGLLWHFPMVVSWKLLSEIELNIYSA